MPDLAAGTVETNALGNGAPGAGDAAHLLPAHRRQALASSPVGNLRVVGVIPVYNHGGPVGAVVQGVLEHGLSCIVVDDGSGPECAAVLDELAERWGERVVLVRLPTNRGKGGAMIAGLNEAIRRGFSHALQIDADGQHDVASVGAFLREAAAHPAAVICGVPRFDATVPRGRLYGRYATHVWVWINTLSLTIVDSMCGFRVYPLTAMQTLLHSTRMGQRMDFDVEVLVRLYWQGVDVVNVPTTVTYPQDGVSHFRLWRDNVALSWLHMRLFFGMLRRLPHGVRRKTRHSDAHTHWSRIGENTFVTGMQLLMLVHRLLGRTPFRLCVYPVVAYYYLTRRVARQASRQYLQRLQAATGALGEVPNWRHSLRHFALFAETLLDKVLALGGAYPRERIVMRGRDVFAEHVAQGRGAVIVTAHVGCLELMRVMSQTRQGLRLNVLVHTRHAQEINRFFRRINPEAGINLIEVTELSVAVAVRLSERVAAGELVVIAGDRAPVQGHQVARVNFLGHPAPFPVGPYVLAALLKCPLFLLGCLHDGDHGYTMHFARLAEGVELPRQTREVALMAYAAAYAQALEGWLERSPYDWFNFYPFWDQQVMS